jgi:hypothetical protein
LLLNFKSEADQGSGVSRLALLFYSAKVAWREVAEKWLKAAA